MNRVDLVAEHFYNLMVQGLGLDLSDPNLTDTPDRVARMLCNELLANTHTEYPAEAFAAFPNDRGFDQIVMIDNIHFTSVCSHHFLPFSGKAWFLYKPKKDGLLAGASKLPRLIEHYSKRPQLQENLCHEIINRFVEIMDPEGVMLVMRAVHGCMSCRGVEQYNNTGMVSSAIYGCFEDATVRNEALNLIQLSTHTNV